MQCFDVLTKPTIKGKIEKNHKKIIKTKTKRNADLKPFET